VGNSQYGGVFEGFVNQFVNFLFCYDVNICGGLVKDDDFILAKDGSTDADQLLFAHRQAITAVVELVVDSFAISFVTVDFFNVPSVLLLL